MSIPHLPQNVDLCGAFSFQVRVGSAMTNPALRPVFAGLRRGADEKPCFILSYPRPQRHRRR